jgi:hypothetical protein
MEADRVRTLLHAAVREGEEFDPVSGEPESWRPAPDAVSTYAWARRWLGEQWPEWQPRTRVAALESLIRFVPLAVALDASAPPPGLRRYLLGVLPPDGVIDADSAFERWLGRWSLPLNRLDAEVLARVDQRLGIGDQGQPLAGSTANRYRRVAHSCIRRAVELRVLSADPWPPPPRGRNRRRANRPTRRAELRRLPDPATMAAAITAMPNQYQPSSRMYQMMTAVAYYGGLRPSEVTVLRRRCIDLPADGWGRIDVVAAFDLDDETADPKTGARQVPWVKSPNGSATASKSSSRRTSAPSTATTSPPTTKSKPSSHRPTGGTLPKTLATAPVLWLGRSGRGRARRDLGRGSRPRSPASARSAGQVLAPLAPVLLSCGTVQPSEDEAYRH